MGSCLSSPKPPTAPRPGSRSGNTSTPNTGAAGAKSQNISASTGSEIQRGASPPQPGSSVGGVAQAGAPAKSQTVKNSAKDRVNSGSSSASGSQNNTPPNSSTAKEQKPTSKKGKGKERSVSQSPQGNTPSNASGPSEQLDYTGRVTTKSPPDTSHKLLNSYTGEVKGGKDKDRVTVKALRTIGNGKNDPNFKKWTTAVDQRLRREFGGWKRITGPFVEYIGFATVDGVPAVLTQFVEGTSAKEAFAKKNAQEKRRLVLEFANALRTLHREQLFHGNIEPRHFIVDKQDKAKLGGFCFNQMIEDELRKINPSEEYRRSARYTPPEVLENKPANGKSDVYSFACVAVELLTGKIPFSTIPQEAAVTQLAVNGETHLSKDYAELGNDPWWPTFKLCWSKNVEARPLMENLCERLSSPPKK